MRRLAIYFGYGDGGHFARAHESVFAGHGKCLDPDKELAGFPWTCRHLDGQLLGNRRVTDIPDGRVHWTSGGALDHWHAFFWWDRSGDPRPASNSGFYVRGWPFTTRDNLEAERREAFAYACEQWPDVVARQLYPLVLESGS